MDTMTECWPERIATAVAGWLGRSPLTPPLRQVLLPGSGPPTAWPSGEISVVSEDFSPGDGEATLRLELSIACASGQAGAAFAACRSLAYQARSMINGSHNLGGLARRLAVERIRYGAPEPAPRGVTARAVLELSIRYLANPVG